MSLTHLYYGKKKTRREKGCWRAHAATSTCHYQPLSDFYKEQKIVKWDFSMSYVQLILTGEENEYNTSCASVIH